MGSRNLDDGTWRELSTLVVERKELRADEPR